MSSNLWLGLALVGTFFTVFIVGLLVEMVLSSRRHYVSVLQTQVGDMRPETLANLRDEQLRKSPLERLVLPLAGRLVRSVIRHTPLDLYGRTNRLIVLAGNPPGLKAERVVAFKVVFAIVGLVSGLAIGSVLPVPSSFKLLAIVLFALMGYTIPSAAVSARASKRQKEIRKSLSDTMDLLTISVEAGLGFDAALAQVVKNVPGPLSQEIARTLQEMQIGVHRMEALRHLSDRTDVEELDGFVLSMIQADKYGVGVANVLRGQSKELRQKRRQRAEETAQKVPLKLLFPTIFMILPALFIVILGPGAIKVYETFFK
jgi:tight adherence protein C